MTDIRDQRPLYRVSRDQRHIVFTAYLEDDTIEARVPCTFEVCHVCGGRGTHVNPGVDSHGITADEMAEDPDFAEDYLSGVYDQVCNWCGGARVEAIPNPRTDRDRELIEALYEQERQDAADRQTRLHEMGIGW